MATEPDIVVSTHTFLPIVGGAELGIHEIYSRIGRRRRVSVITPCLPSALLDDYAADDYATDRYSVCYTQPSSQSSTLRAVRARLDRTFIPYLVTILRIRKRHPAVVANFHFFRSHSFAIVILRLLGVPVVLSMVGRSDVFDEMSPARRWYCAQIARFAAAVTPISAYYTAQRDMKNAHVIPYGVDIHEFSPRRRARELWADLGIDPGDTVLLCAQRLAPIKRVDVLIETLARLNDDRGDISLVVVGQGEEESRLRRHAEGLGVAHKVRFAGYVPSAALPVYFASADIFVCHSMMETFGLVFAQAMASAIPIVAADTSCVPYVVVGDNPLVMPFDSAAFARAVDSLANDDGRRTCIGTANRLHAEQNLNWDRIASEYEALLDAVSGFASVDRE